MGRAPPHNILVPSVGTDRPMASPAVDPRILALLAMPHDDLAAWALKLEHALVQGSQQLKEHVGSAATLTERNARLSEENESLRRRVSYLEVMQLLT